MQRLNPEALRIVKKRCIVSSMVLPEEMVYTRVTIEGLFRVCVKEHEKLNIR